MIWLGIAAIEFLLVVLIIYCIKRRTRAANHRAHERVQSALDEEGL